MPPIEDGVERQRDLTWRKVGRKGLNACLGGGRRSQEIVGGHGSLSLLDKRIYECIFGRLARRAYLALTSPYSQQYCSAFMGNS